MTDTKTDTKSPEYKQLLENLARDLAPTLEAAAKDAVAAASPGVAVVVDPVLDGIDLLINRMLGVTVSSTQPAPSTDVGDRLMALENHVAALTVSTGAATAASLRTAKVAVANLPAPAAS